MELLTSLAVATTLLVNGRTNATPTIAVDGRFVVVAWTASEPSGSTDVFAAASHDGAATFGAPVKVNDTPGGVRANGEQPPRIALTRRAGGDPAITIVWGAKGSSGTKLLWARSDNGGRSFSAAATVPGSDAHGDRGWHNAVADANGRVYVVWLDHRELAHDMSAMHHDRSSSEKPDGVAMAQKSKLFLAALDGSTAPHPLLGGVCYCCKTALAADPNGTVYAAWRHVFAGNIRDIAFAESHDGGQTITPLVRVSDDQWELEGCPDDGPSIAIDSTRRVHVIWPTMVMSGSGDPTVAIFYATSRDGKTFTPRARLPTEGTPRHPQIAVAPDGSIVAAWDEMVGGTRRAVVARARATSDGAPRFDRIFASEDVGVYPAIAVDGASTIVVYPSRDAIRITRAE
jgi:hypothetical protein